MPVWSKNVHSKITVLLGQIESVVFSCENVRILVLLCPNLFVMYLSIISQSEREPCDFRIHVKKQVGNIHACLFLHTYCIFICLDEKLIKLHSEILVKGTHINALK